MPIATRPSKSACAFIKRKAIRGHCAALGKLLRAPRFLDWRQSRDFARELDPVIDILSDIAATDPANGVALFEHALTRLFKIYEQCDDSGGDIGDRMREIADRSLKCLASQPNGATRAKALLALQRVKF